MSFFTTLPIHTLLFLGFISILILYFYIRYDDKILVYGPTILREFKIDDFFEQYPKSLHSRLPGNTSNNAPLNIYPENFAKISQKLRGDLGRICQSCRSDFSAPSKRKWLHVHHINGLKHDNNKSNLAVLCISCHA